MRIFRLSPIDLADEDWSASAWLRPAIVRARTERLARTAADMAFGIAPPKTGRLNRILASPWSQRHLVSAEILPPSRAATAHGPIAILDPVQEPSTAARIAGLVPEWWLGELEVGPGQSPAAVHGDSPIRSDNRCRHQSWWSRLLTSHSRASVRLFAVASFGETIQAGCLGLL